MQQNENIFKIFVVAVMMLLPQLIKAQQKENQQEVNKKIISDNFKKWADGTGNFFNLLATDVNWTVTGASPISKTYVSRIEFINEAIIPLNKRLSIKIVPTVKAIYAENDMLVVLWEGNATAKDGKPYDNTYSWHLQMKNGKIVNAVAFFDTVDLAEIWDRIPLKN